MGTKCTLASNIWRSIIIGWVHINFPFLLKNIKKFHSIDGQVKLWDLRGPDCSIETFDLLRNGLSAFDVHPTSGVFAVYVLTNAYFAYCQLMSF